jgi:TRAP transporter TAXI family solute receptor
MREKIKLIAFLMAILVAAGCSPSGPTKTRLSIATGGTGGVFYPYGGGIAKVITEHVPNVEATAEVTAASVDNIKFLRDKKADLAFTTADTLADAVNGTDVFQGGKVPIRALAVLYHNYTHVVTLESNRIKTLADLKGRVVSTGAAGSGTEVVGYRILQALGINPSTDIHKQSLGASQSVDALKDGKIDAFFWNGGLPTAAILDLAHTPGLTLRMLSSAVALEQLAYDITRALFEHKADLVAIHPEANKLALQSAIEGSPAPFHAGAIRYYTEQHVWGQ